MTIFTSLLMVAPEVSSMYFHQYYQNHECHNYLRYKNGIILATNMQTDTWFCGYEAW